MQQTNKTPIPTSIQKKSDSEMLLVWNTGENTVIPFKTLRFNCRCAACVDEWTRERKIQLSQIREDIKPSHVEPVGRYAIQIDWNDGHRTGIYTYEMLYQIANHEKHEGAKNVTKNV